MKNLTLLFFVLVFFYSTATFADEAFFSSRNMPSSCEYVFSVESDLRLELPLDLNEDKIMYQLQNSWAPFEWTAVAILALQDSSVATGGPTRFAEWSFQSMSIPKNYLFRIIKIFFPKSNITCIAEFGRQFGEACMPEGRIATPWRTRLFNCEPTN